MVFLQLDYWQPLRLLTFVKLPALPGRHDFFNFTELRFAFHNRDERSLAAMTYDCVAFPMSYGTQ
ncbi:hypothetical protein FACS189449_06460 [Alphaproteobacteria bacterium]|nr:hypothetical protein FACS189449_06460 [Alphaproteobacteria bacterium]